MSDDFIPYSKPSIGREEIDAVTKVLESGWLTMGKVCQEFEEKIKEYTGAKFVAVVDSCTSALTLSIEGTVGEGSSILLPALTFIATANAAYHAAGKNIYFCDVGWDGNIDTKLIDVDYDLVVPVHFAGQVCDLPELNLYANHIIEDAAHAFGIRSLGTSPYSDGACFSFYPTKPMTTAEGGCFISNDDDLVKYVKEVSIHGLGYSHIDRYNRTNVNQPVANFPGYKANMTDIEAAIGIEQLKKLPYFNIIRRKIADYYTEELKDNVRLLERNGRDHTWHMFVILVDNRNEFIKAMKEKGIGTSIHYSPIIPAHPFYREMTDYYRGDFPVAEYIADHCVSLPIYPSMTTKEMERVVKAVKELC